MTPQVFLNFFALVAYITLDNHTAHVLQRLVGSIENTKY